jgi:hypothetical protein
MNTHSFVLLLMLTLKIMSSFHIVGLETCDVLWALLHTCIFVTCLLVILFLCDLQTLKSILGRAEVMLQEIKKMKFIIYNLKCLLLNSNLFLLWDFKSRTHFEVNPLSYCWQCIYLLLNFPHHKKRKMFLFVCLYVCSSSNELFIFSFYFIVS